MVVGADASPKVVKKLKLVGEPFRSVLLACPAIMQGFAAVSHAATPLAEQTDLKQPPDSLLRRCLGCL